MFSPTGIAQEVTGRIQDFRRVLEFNPQSLPFEFPPGIQMGIDTANTALGSLGVDFQIPTVDQIQDLALGEVDEILGPLRGTVLESLTEAQEALQEQLGTADRILNSIEWLL